MKKLKLSIVSLMLLAAMSINAQGYLPVDEEFDGAWYFDRAVVQERAQNSQDEFAIRSISADEFTSTTYLYDIPDQIVFMGYDAHISHPSWSKHVFAIIVPWNNNKLEFREMLSHEDMGDLSKIDESLPVGPAFTLAQKTTGMSLQFVPQISLVGENLERIVTIYYRRTAKALTPSVEPTEDGAVIKWQTYDDIESHRLLIYSDEAHTEPVYTIELDATGDRQNAKGIQRAQDAAGLLFHTVEGLQSNTPYYFTLEMLGVGDVLLASQSGDFTTDVASDIGGIKHIQSLPVAYYNLQGAQLQQEPESGTYIILYDNGKAEKVLKQSFSASAF